MFGQHIQNIASFFGTFDVSLPFAGPLSDKLGRRISVLIGAASYVIFFIGIAFSPNIQVAYVAAVLGGIAIGILGVLAIFAPILIGFTSTATFQLWLNCAQTFGKEIAGIPSASVSMMQTYYSAGTMVALLVTSLRITKFKQVRFLVIYPVISVAMLVLVYLVKTPMICFVGAFVIGYAAAGGVLQMATATVNDLFPNIKGDHYQSGHDRIQSVQLYNFKCGSENVIHAGDHDEHCYYRYRRAAGSFCQCGIQKSFSEDRTIKKRSLRV